MKIFLVVLFSVLILGCNGRKTPVTAVSEEDSDMASAEVPDTLVVEQNMVVFWWPDSTQQVAMKNSLDEISYRKFVDDMTWYNERAIQMLDSFRIASKITDRDVIVFKAGGISKVTIERDETKGNMVLFRENKEPLITSMNNFNRKEVISFFK
ncbi:MAG TPA: hypothetical protein VK179_09380 [Bacteroidales bacterium]|nr:hypothetical protein [Bacteroidales bacterium]